MSDIKIGSVWVSKKNVSAILVVTDVSDPRVETHWLGDPEGKFEWLKDDFLSKYEPVKNNSDDSLTVCGSANDLTGDEIYRSQQDSEVKEWKGICPSCNKIQAPQSIDAMAIKNGGVCQICQFIQNCSDDSADIQVAPSEQSTADQILKDAIATMVERGKSYDKSGNDKERSMPQIVAAFEAVTGIKLTPEQGNKFMVIVKLVRSEQGEDKPDNYIDGAAYMALAGEAAIESVTHG